ncbi:MarR family winged helix-turn-helix transcriptional regulator [Vagococcus vulneris]|nr:MarR family winged helix-turn-helix transcriptional regulator [Vagococcus vulneris]
MTGRQVNQVFYQVKILEQQIAKIFEERVGISLSRYKLLLILQEKGPCLHSTLKEEMQIDQGAITRHLKVLENEGHVLRQRNPKNNREVFVELTNTAKNKLIACEHKHQQFEALLGTYVDETDLTNLSGLLESLTSALKAIEEK